MTIKFIIDNFAGLPKAQKIVLYKSTLTVRNLCIDVVLFADVLLMIYTHPQCKIIDNNSNGLTDNLCSILTSVD